VGKCKACTTSQIKKDAERHVAQAEAMGQKSSLTDTEVAKANSTVPLAPQDKWCCAYRVLLLQDDFVNEKPLLQHYLEGRGHICLFLPKFHCKLNPIEMLWGYVKYRESYLTGYKLITHHSKVIGQLLMENLPQRRSLFPSVLICVTPRRFGDSSVKPGDIWTLTGTFLILSICIVDEHHVTARSSICSRQHLP
jgi:hypothetical protein